MPSLTPVYFNRADRLGGPCRTGMKCVQLSEPEPTPTTRAAVVNRGLGPQDCSHIRGRAARMPAQRGASMRAGDGWQMRQSLKRAAARQG